MITIIKNKSEYIYLVNYNLKNINNLILTMLILTMLALFDLLLTLHLKRCGKNISFSVEDI